MEAFLPSVVAPSSESPDPVADFTKSSPEFMRKVVATFAYRTARGPRLEPSTPA